MKMIKSIEDEVIKSQYIKKFVDAFDMDESEVKTQLQKVKDTKLEFPGQKRDETEGIAVTNNIGLVGYPQPEVYLLSLLFKGNKTNLPFYTNSIDDELFTNKQTRSLFSDLKRDAEHKKSLDIKAFYDKLSDSHPDLYCLFEKIYLFGTGEDQKDIEVFDAEIASVIRRLKVDFLKRKLKELSKAIKQAEAMSDNEKIDTFQDQVKEYTRELSDLSF